MVCTPLVSPLFYPAGIHGLVVASLYQLHWIRWWRIRIPDGADFLMRFPTLKYFFISLFISQTSVLIKNKT